jgi:hypothetical protein
VNRENFGMAVRDSNGLIWSNVIGDQPKNQPQANEICKTLGARLPSSDELFKGENKGGFFDVLPNIKIPVWSSTLGPGINEAYYYGGDHYIYFADITAPQIFVRCVAIASKKTR